MMAIEIAIAFRSPWWSLPLRTMGLWSLAVTLLLLPLSIWMAHGKTWALRTTGAIAVIWCTVTAAFAVWTQNFWLGFFNLGLCLFWWVLFSWLKREMTRSFFDPNLRWYQGLPKAIPKLECEVIARNPRVKGKGIRQVFQVSRMDREGAFLFSRKRNADVMRSLSRGRAKLNFNFYDKKISVRGVPVRVFDHGLGFGYRFVPKDSDHAKNLGDFIEKLQGEGYVG